MPKTVEGFDKAISRKIAFKDRMIALNDQLKEGKPEGELKISVFEIELRSRERNFQWAKLDNGQFVKLFSWELIKRSINEIAALREGKIALQNKKKGK